MRTLTGCLNQLVRNTRTIRHIRRFDPDMVLKLLHECNQLVAHATWITEEFIKNPDGEVTIK